MDVLPRFDAVFPNVFSLISALQIPPAAPKVTARNLPADRESITNGHVETSENRF
jgi:hypothetical protein